MPAAARLQVPNAYHGANSHIDLSVPPTKVQREQAMVSTVFPLVTLIFSCSARW